MTKFEYTLHVEWGDFGCTAWIGEPDEPADASPLKAVGPTPILAMAALADVLKEWPETGADRWLSTPAGQTLARMFVPGFKGWPARGAA